MTGLQAASRWVSQATAPLHGAIRWSVLALLLYLVAAVNAIILLRVAFGWSLPWIMDSAQLVAPWLAVLAAADAFARGAHPGMEFFLLKAPPRRRRILRIAIQSLTLGVLFVLAVFSWGYAQMGRAITITSMDFLTMFPFYLSLPVGFGCMFIVSLERTLRVIAFDAADRTGG